MLFRRNCKEKVQTFFLFAQVLEHLFGMSHLIVNAWGYWSGNNGRVGGSIVRDDDIEKQM